MKNGNTPTSIIKKKKKGPSAVHKHDPQLSRLHSLNLGQFGIRLREWCRSYYIFGCRTVKS